MVFLLCDQEVWVRPRLEGGLVRVAAATAAGVSTPATAAALLATGGSAGRPRVVGGSAAALLAAAGAAAPAAATLAATALTLATAAGGLGDLGRGAAQAGADFLDVQFVDRALDALTVLVGPLL